MLTTLLVIAVLVQAFILFLALFEPDLKYEVTDRPRCPLDAPECIRLLGLLTDARLSKHTRIEILKNGSCYYDAELEAIRSAQQTVHIEAYIFQRGEVTRRFLEVLTERARAGVKVRLVLDAVGSFASWNSYFADLRRAGGCVAWYHSFHWHTLPYVNNRTHREVIVVDGKTAFVGGSGFADHWLLPRKGEPPWRDTMFRVTGSAVAELQAAFAENWLESTGQILADETCYESGEAQTGTDAMVIDSSPSAGRGTRARILFQTLLAAAQHSIHVTTPYFLPDASARREMIRAVQERGVKMKVIVPGKHSDHLLTRRSSRRIYGDLLQAGIEIYEYEPAMIHTKSLVVDSTWSIVGSTNFDHRSFGLNDEINVVVCCKTFAAQMEQDFAADLAVSHQVKYEEWRRRPITERVHESLGWLLERQE